jgi:hypothetical protein
MTRCGLQLPLMPPDWRWATFEKIAPPNCRRSYRIEIRESSEGWAVMTYRCRIGHMPRPMEEHCSSLKEARSIADKRAHDRLLHGYALTGIGP